MSDPPPFAASGTAQGNAPDADPDADPPADPAADPALHAALLRIAELERERDAALDQCRRLSAAATHSQRDALTLVARASHEIRTPLSGVLGLVELAARLSASEVQRRHLDMAAASGRALTDVLNDVLDLASLGAAPAAVQRREPVDLDTLFTDALRSITPRLVWGNCAVVYDYDSDAAQVLAEPGRLRQVVINLLGNAAKWTENGRIGLSARVRRIGAGRCALELLIEDTGPGIPPEALPVLFEPFGLSDEARKRGGTGLGLSIVRAIVAAMGGTISVDSTVGVGTRFLVQLQLDALPGAAEPPPPAGGVAWLVYEPPFVEGGEVLRRRFARLGWAAAVLPGIEATLRQALTAQPDVLLVAAHSVSSADDLARLSAALPRARLLLVSRADWQRADIEEHALDLGVPSLLVPLAHRTLLQIVGQTVGQVSGHNVASDPVAKPTAGAPAPLKGSVLLVDDDEVNRIIGEHQLAAMGLRVRSVGSGEAALDACDRAPPDLVLMDVQMPGIGGVEACRRLCGAQRLGRLPPFKVIGLTADSTPTTADAARAAGMAAVLIKPCPAAVLYRELSLHLPAAPAA